MNLLASVELTLHFLLTFYLLEILASAQSRVRGLADSNLASDEKSRRYPFASTFSVVMFFCFFP